MPELPEVETVKRQLERFLVSETVATVDLRTPSLLHGNSALLQGKTVRGVRRFSKLIVIDFSGNLSLAIHLKMTGRLIYYSEKYATKKENWEYDYFVSPHTHLRITFASEAQLFFNDYRKFGTIDVVPTDKLQTLSYIKNLGKEFLKDLTKEEFKKTLSLTSRAIKVVLLDQTELGGVGNIYANEGLWQAKVHPEIPAKKLTPSQSDSLFLAIEGVMTEAITYGGASSDNFRDLFGAKGHAQEHFSVYGKEGKPCPRCSTAVQKYFFGGRGTYVCESCQKNSN